MAKTSFANSSLESMCEQFNCCISQVIDQLKYCVRKKPHREISESKFLNTFTLKAPQQVMDRT